MLKLMHYLLALLFMTSTALSQSVEASLQSPDGRLTIGFRTVSDNKPAPEGGQLVYEVSFQGKPLIEPSALRLHLQGQTPLGANVRIVSTAPSKTDETYRLVTGKAGMVRNHDNALRVDLEEHGEPGRKFAMEARAFDDAVAFRYFIPAQQPIPEFRLTREQTEFRISKDAFAHALVLPNYGSM